MSDTKVRFRDIPQFPRAHYEVDVMWSYLEKHLESELKEGLDLEPDFQRGHVWTEDQQRKYVEYVLRGGEVGRQITFNAPRWPSPCGAGEYVIVDGKQRLEAARKFLRGDLTVFGGLRYQDFGDKLAFDVSFRFRVCKLATRAELLQLYLNINAGGTPHTAEEIERVRQMYEVEVKIDAIRKDLKTDAVAKKKWNGLCPAGKHGLDHEGQRCDLCHVADPTGRPDPEFIATLTAGDLVHIYDRMTGYVYNSRVKKVTPSGLVKLDDDAAFKNNGWMRDSVYGYTRFLVDPRLTQPVTVNFHCLHCGATSKSDVTKENQFKPRSCTECGSGDVK